MERHFSFRKFWRGTLLSAFLAGLLLSPAVPIFAAVSTTSTTAATTTPNVKPPKKILVKKPPKNPAPAQPSQPSPVIPAIGAFLNFLSILNSAFSAAGIGLPGGGVKPPQLPSSLNGVISPGGGSGGGGGGGTFGGKIEMLVDCKAPAGAKWFMVVGPVAGPQIWMPGTPVASPSDGKNTIGNNSSEAICVVSEHDHRPGKIVTLIGVSQ